MKVNYFLALLFFASLAFGERERTEEEAAALAAGEDLTVEEAPRPAHLPDLRKNEKIKWNPKAGPITWNMGPTGIIGLKNGKWTGDQVRVVAVLPGSPAHGQIVPGDVILGIGGEDYVPGEHMGYHTGNAIIKAEEEASGGKLPIHVWRDKNWTKRNTAKDVAGVDVDELFAKAEGDADLYDWKEEEEKAQAVKEEKFSDHPVDPVDLSLTLQLEVMGTYSETSPWDCPVAAKIRENAWSYIENRFQPENKNGRRGRVRGNSLDAIALVASGKPEHRELVKEWVRSPHCRGWKPDRKTKFNQIYQSWHVGFGGLDCAIYYDATGDDYVLPALREYALSAALGQNGGGSWGHSFSMPGQNGGEFHLRNPGYGAMNNAGSRCFFLLALANKNGIDHPEVVNAIRRADVFFRTYVDKGCIPYGFHPPWGSDDSNGKNFGAAYAFHVLGDHHSAKFYSQMSTHAAFTRRGGHASPTLWHYTPLSAAIAGPKGIQITMRNMRWFYTLARRHDGSFVIQGEQAGIGGKPSRSPTATYAMYYSHPMKQLITTGKDANEKEWHTEGDIERLLISARGQLGDPKLIETAGKPAKERPSDELLELLNVFMPKARHSWAKTIGERIKNGEHETLPKVVALLDREDPRYRQAALVALREAGADAVLENMTTVIPLLSDAHEFVRMDAVKTLSAATGYDPNKRYEQLFEAAASEPETLTMDHGNLHSAVVQALFPRKSKVPNEFATTPFEVGLDPALVRAGLRNLITMDPGGYVSTKWTQDSLIRLAGPVTHVAEFVQLNDAMFGFGRTRNARKLLEKHGYVELLECTGTPMLDRLLLRRDVRLSSRGAYSAKDPMFDRKTIYEYKGANDMLLPAFHQWLLDDPNAAVQEKINKRRVSFRIADMIKVIEADKKPKTLPSLRPEVARLFQQELEEAGNSANQIKHCRAELKDPNSRWIFRQLAAMDALAELLGPEVIADLVPYLALKDHRLRTHSRLLAAKAVKLGAAPRLAERLQSADAPSIAAGLTVLTEAGQGLPTVREYLQHEDPLVRKSAIEGVFALDAASGFDQVIANLRDSSDRDVLWGCENALLSKAHDAAHKQRTIDSLIPMLAKADTPQAEVIAFVLAQMGTKPVFDALQQAVVDSEDNLGRQKGIVVGLSYAPEREADRVLINIAKQGKEQAKIVAQHAARRLVIGPNGMNDVTDKQRVDFARKLLRVVYSRQVINYLATVNTAPAVALLFHHMKVGHTGDISGVIVENVEKMDKMSPRDSNIIAEVLIDVIEFIEVTHLRGGVEGKSFKSYPRWKALQARAGKALLKFHNPKAAPIPTLRDSELDF